MALPKNRKKRKKKQRNPVLDWLGYAVMRVALFILFLFPVRWCLRFACFLGNLMWKHYHRGRQRAMENLRASFPDKDEDWLAELKKNFLTVDFATLIFSLLLAIFWFTFLTFYLR
jgi:KDO2-lipid IV(A) lauroyltransferase